jgi:hypothetical protein
MSLFECGRNDDLMAKLKKSTMVIIAIVIICVAIYYGWWIFLSGDNLYTASRNAPNREALRKIHQMIDLEMSYEDVLHVYWKESLRDLRLYAESPESWYISTPLEFSATNWDLNIDFTDEQVSALRIRILDGAVPQDGPQDKVKNSYSSPR